MDILNDPTLLIKKKLYFTWGPFFSRYGQLTPIQKEVIPNILEGRNVIVSAPTATGKTESVVAPLIEKLINSKNTGLGIIYIVPTRALANDALLRIKGPINEVGLTVDKKHGDKPYLSQLPNCLITTPESLDSLICRHSQYLNNVQSIIIDEVHIIDNMYRGDQLRILLKRIIKIAKFDIQTVLISATIADIAAVGKKYMKNPVSVSVSGARDISFQIVHSQDEVISIAKKEKYKKILEFCNLRESVEMVSSIVSVLWKPYPVVVHHGSLSKMLREEAEKVMKENDVAICVATSTLEIGVDIGSIDLVVLAEPPFSLSSLIQRIGRSNRRTNVINVLAVTKNDLETEILLEMIKRVNEGKLEEIAYQPDPSVIVQQSFSLLFENRSGLSDDNILFFLSDIYSKENIKSVLNNLRKTEWIEKRGNRWYATTKLLDIAELGVIHSNIPDNQSYSVVDIATGKIVGSIGNICDQVFLLGHSSWRVSDVIGNKIHVKRFIGKASSAIFRPSSRLENTVISFHNS